MVQVFALENYLTLESKRHLYFCLSSPQIVEIVLFGKLMQERNPDTNCVTLKLKRHLYFLFEQTTYGLFRRIQNPVKRLRWSILQR